jgi:hypothetical protein
MTLRLSEFLVGIGRVIAYYPGLRRITGSTTSAVLLSQFIYWHSKTPDGWFYKSRDELTSEVCLTHEEQKTARIALLAKDLIEERYERTTHQFWFRVKLDTLNKLWGEIEDQKEVYPPAEPSVPEAYEPEKENPVALERAKEIQNKTSRATKKDLVDGALEFAMSPGIKKSILKDEIESYIAVSMHVNPSGPRWEALVNYAADRWLKDHESIKVFVAWWLDNNPNPAFWSPDKMKSLWPQAFIKQSQPEVAQPQYTSEPIEEEVGVPMPHGIGKD